ncbi:4'-phosphopantetheinyl transferase superfamily protein [Methyloglobulus sp.]|uniref:4'-phosphopantetheinyl transferase family protein n=1 Tax=Methyloglobulus sp. TaxID=2518622 RepID=UPI0032B8520E
MVCPEIKLWHGDIAASEADYGQYWQILDQVEQQHACNIKNGQLHQRYVEIHARLRILLGDAVNAPPEQLRIVKAEHGKPYLIDYPKLAFNLSHTANRMVVAIAYDCALGVDIELCKPRTNLAALVDKCFAEEEKNYWQQLPKAQQKQAFYRFWTRKEAFVKATGRGIALGLNQCVFNPDNLNELLRIPDGYGETGEWMIQDIDMDMFIYGALACWTGSSSVFHAR